MGNFKIKSEKGVTLVEVLAAITLLSIVLISMLSIFPQMGLVNNHNESKAKATNLAKEVLIDWQESNEVKIYITNPNQVDGFISTNPKITYTSFNKDDDYYYFETTRDQYVAEITIKKSPDKKSKKSSVHLISVQLINDKGNVVSETLGYIKTYGYVGG